MTLSPIEQLQAADIGQFNCSEGTTNPTLLYLASRDPAYKELVDSAAAYAKSLDTHSTQERLQSAIDYLAVQFGTQIYKLTGRVSTEVDVTLSFDTQATVASALRVLELYKQEGVPKEAVRVKISATWEGIQAARILQKEHGVSCLVTIVFSLIQAVAAAEAGADAVAPYVGRMADWGKRNGIEDDLGVQRVSLIQNYMRKHGFKTQVMAASFRNTSQIRALAGIDCLTASPSILTALMAESEPISPKLTMESAQSDDPPRMSYINDEAAFRWDLNQDECAEQMSADAMRRFSKDTDKLKYYFSKLIL